MSEAVRLVADKVDHERVSRLLVGPGNDGLAGTNDGRAPRGFEQNQTQTAGVTRRTT